MTNNDQLENLRQAIAHFVTQRQWQSFHNPKNLAMALCVECSELVEIFQWLSFEQSSAPDEATCAHIKEEIGDIMIYLTMVASAFGIDPIQAGRDKLQLNEKKYPLPEQKDNQPL